MTEPNTPTSTLPDDTSQSSSNSSHITLSPSVVSLSSSSQDDLSSTSESSEIQQDSFPSTSHSGELARNLHIHSGHQVSSSMISKIHALWHLAGLSYPAIAAKTHISLSTVYRIGHLPSPLERKPRLGHPFLLRCVQRKKLISLTTSSASNRYKPLSEIAFLAGIQASSQTLQCSFANEGYHRSVAWKKPFLSPKTKTVS